MPRKGENIYKSLAARDCRGTMRSLTGQKKGSIKVRIIDKYILLSFTVRRLDQSDLFSKTP